MNRNHDLRLEQSAVQARYDNPSFFNDIDHWHLFTANEIRREISKVLESYLIQPSHMILNAGAGGNNLGLPPTTISLDLSATRLALMTNPVVGSVEQVPFQADTFDFIFCVGSVINYCDAAMAISEFGRTLKLNGHLIIEFESSFSAELMTQDAYGRTAAVAETFYAGQSEAVWVYSPTYIHRLLRQTGFNLKRSIPIHILSPWALLLSRNVRMAASIAFLDRWMRSAHLLTRWASNHLLFCEKRI